MNVVLGKDGAEKEVVDTHPTNQMYSEAINVLDDVTTEVLSSSLVEIPFVTYNIIGRL